MAIPLHPALVHIPLGLSLAVPFLAAGIAYGLFSGRLTRNAWALLIGVQLIAAVGAFAAATTGDAEGERVEHRVPEAAVEAHEEAAEQFAVAVGLVLVAAIAVAATLKDPRRLAWGATGVAVLALAVAALGVRAGHKGGELVFVHGAGTSAPAAALPASQAAPTRPLLDD